jgi:hypothetical protein
MEKKARELLENGIEEKNMKLEDNIEEEDSQESREWHR